MYKQNRVEICHALNYTKNTVSSVKRLLWETRSECLTTAAHKHPTKNHPKPADSAEFTT